MVNFMPQGIVRWQERIAGAGITKSNVVDLNRHLLKGCNAYYFANNPAECF